MKTIFRRWYGKFKSRIQRRLDKKHHNSGERPAFTARNINFDVSFREHGMVYGGIGAFHLLVQELGLKHRSKRTINCADMKFAITVDRDEDGMWVVECPSIPGCVSQGHSRDEALNNIREAIAGCLEVRAERGMPLTVETSQVEVAV